MPDHAVSQHAGIVTPPSSMSDEGQVTLPEGDGPLRCPECHGPLAITETAATCESCGAQYERDGRVIRFVADDDFYEGAYLNRLAAVPDGSWLGELRFYLVNTHYLWWARRWIPAGGRLLELACGGGVTFFTEHARVTGVDLSRSSLRQLDSAYEHALQADALALPLRDCSYDAIVSSYFFEHIPGTRKDALLAELRRVLRPGGRMVFLFDVESHGPVFRMLRANQERYREAIVERDRHYGLEPASAALARIERAGFKVLAHHGANKTLLQNASVYSWMHEYEGGPVQALVRFGAFVSKSPAIAKAYTALVTLADDVMEPIFPLDWSRVLLVAAERI